MTPRFTIHTITACLLAICAAPLFAMAASQPPTGLAGRTWTADMTRSTLHSANRNVRAMTLTFTVEGARVTIRDSVTDTSGREIGQGATVFVTPVSIYGRDV